MPLACGFQRARKRPHPIFTVELFMIKINDLIVALQQQQEKYGNIDLSIDIVPEKVVPKEGQSKYLHVFGLWSASADDEQGKCEHEFEFHKDDQYGDWLELIFIKGRIDGEIEHLPRKGLIEEVEKNRIIDARKIR